MSEQRFWCLNYHNDQYGFHIHVLHQKTSRFPSVILQGTCHRPNLTIKLDLSLRNTIIIIAVNRSATNTGTNKPAASADFGSGSWSCLGQLHFTRTLADSV